MLLLHCRNLPCSPNPAHKPSCIIHTTHKPEAPGAFPGFHACPFHKPLNPPLRCTFPGHHFTHQRPYKPSHLPKPTHYAAAAAAAASLHLHFALQPNPAHKPHCVIHAIHKPEAPGAFPGLYAFSLHEQGFAGPDTLLVTSQWYSQTVILAVSLKDGSVTPVTPVDARKGSWTLQVGGHQP
jgi:hypothetical protein